MIEYRILNEFEYKGKKYFLLCDKKNRYFFLENDSLHNCKRYITIEELLELSQKICIPRSDFLHFEYEQNKTRKIKMIPKIIVAGLVLPLTFTILQSCGIKENDSSYAISYANEYELDKQSKQKLDEFYEKIEIDEDSFEEKSYTENTDTYKSVYDSKGLDQVFHNKKEDITYDNIRELINRLPMSDEYKDIYITLANNLEKQYPNMDLRIWHQNLKNLKVEEKPAEELKEYGIEYGGYSPSLNAIYLQENCSYVPGTESYQIIVHEFTHPIRTARFEIGGITYNCGFSTYYENYELVDEAMTSILAVRSYDPEETKLGYAFMAHMLEVMIECMDNYTMEDYVNEDLSYFITELNNTNGDTEAIRMLNTMELNREDIVNGEIYFPPEQFHDLYDYVARMYYRKNINANMTSEEITEVKDELLSKLLTGLPEKTASSFDAAHFDDYLVEYCNENGINYSPNAKVR